MQLSSAIDRTDHDQLKTLLWQVLQDAKALGATQAEAHIHHDTGFAVMVRQGEVETLEHHRSKGLSVTVYYGHRTGSAVTSDLTPQAVSSSLEKACNIARFTGEDPCNGLADAELMAHHYPDLDLYHPWPITPAQGIEIARECEAIARDQDKRITNSEGASVNTHAHYELYGNSHDFLGDCLSTYHTISCTLIAQHGGEMQCDNDYTCARDSTQLNSISALAKSAAQRTVQRLDAKRLSTRHAPVIFHADVARSLIGHFLAAISGGNLFRKSSFLLDSLHQQIFPAHLHIEEQPHLPKGIGSTPFDSEGVATQARRSLVQNGVLASYLLGSYSARKLGMQTTANAGGSHNVIVQTGTQCLGELLRAMDTGLLVTDLMGQGINMVTGDYSRGAFGFWVEGGVVQYPVQEITIAGNLKDMFLNLVAVGNDVDRRGNVCTGSIWLESMMIAGE